jgi:hypothetical protein
MAIITWFQESAPAQGYGFGACRGAARWPGTLPRRAQADPERLRVHALRGRLRQGAALALVALLALWLVRVVIHHGRASRGDGDARIGRAHAAGVAQLDRGLLGRLTLAQLAITVAGNLGWLPLTGSLPFASFGAWSLLANTFFLALAISLRGGGRDAGAGFAAAARTGGLHPARAVPRRLSVGPARR